MKIGDAHYWPKGEGAYCTRREVGREPMVWHASTPDRRDKRYRIFWIFLKFSPGIALGWWLYHNLPDCVMTFLAGMVAQ